jgi:hypothetical protein
VKSQGMSMLIVFFHIKRILHKEFVLAGQTVNTAITLTFYGDCMNMWEDFTPKCGDRRTGCCMKTVHHLTLLFFTRDFLPKHHDCHPPATLLFTVSPIEDKSERPPF